MFVGVYVFSLFGECTFASQDKCEKICYKIFLVSLHKSQGFSLVAPLGGERLDFILVLSVVLSVVLSAKALSTMSVPSGRHQGTEYYER